jgi:hypothetical protein
MRTVFFGIRPTAFLVAFWIGFGMELGGISVCFFVLKKGTTNRMNLGRILNYFDVFWEALGGPGVAQNTSK